jgi:exopolysaccharide biosynthesis polyprenyl glycosylphosphotransferase
MKRRDASDVWSALRALLADALAIMGGWLLAVWLRFDSGWIGVESRPPALYVMYGWAAAFATLIHLFIFHSLELYRRPQTDRFENKIPRLVRAMAIGLLLSSAFAFAIRLPEPFPPFSRLTFALAGGLSTLLVVLERYLLFRLELHEARHSPIRNTALIVGTDAVAANLARTIRRDPRLKMRIAGFVAVSDEPPAPDLGSEPILGRVEDLERLLPESGANHLMVCDTRLSRERMMGLIIFCERHLIEFLMVPDLFRILTGRVDLITLGSIPLLGMGRWPLDYFGNRLLKRCVDIVGAVIGLIFSAPILIWAAIAIKRSSPGPVFYRQLRCGEGGRLFTLYKLRTMPVDAESESGPVWTKADDPRRTPIGRFLREHNLDELPQFWNVLKGEMSLVGPRPERPYFVEQFRDDIRQYMLRHMSKPGITGWAQVNGLRGDTSIEERIRYDLYYLENWSLAFDFKILLKTLTARENAY